MSKFQAHTLEQHQQALAQYLPNDRLFAAKNIKGKNFYKLLTGLSGELQRVDAIFQSVWDGTNILTTQDVNYIKLWEGFVGIPNSVFTETSSLTLEDRRNNILIKLRSLGVLTAQDFIDLAALLGVVITITPGIEVAYPPYTPPFVPMKNSKAARFTWIIQGPDLDLASYPPYAVPFTPSAPASQLRGLFELLKPSMTTLIFQNS
mgnify:CR=1 FL=1|tara:strand:+ start:23813 stop:24427 length:615 start_codon:yes stop_codon:yes gene_type:complete